MIQNLDQRLFPASENSDSLRQWREQLLNRLLAGALVSGLLAAVPSVVLSINNGLWPVVVADLIAVIWISNLWHRKHVAYHLRIYQLLALIYLLAMVLLVYVGQSSQMYLMAIPILAVLLLDIRTAILALCINAISFLGVGYFSHANHTLASLNSSPFLAWVVIAVNLTGINALLTLSCWFLIRSLEEALQRQRERAQHLHTMLHTDSITGLRTADAQRERIAELIHSGTKFSLMVLNFDDYRLVNNNLGHIGGNSILAQAAKIMHVAVGQHGELARASGAEFTLVLTHYLDQEPLRSFAKRIQASLELPLQFERSIVYVGLSVGIARFPIDASSTDELLRKANVALQDVIAAGGQGIYCYESWMDTSQQEQVWLDHQLHGALAANQFELHYQPKLRLASGRATSVEALLRWMHPHRGNISPDQFIPRAEATGLIVPIGRWIVETAARQAAQWEAKGRAVRVATISLTT